MGFLRPSGGRGKSQVVLRTVTPGCVHRAALAAREPCVIAFEMLGVKSENLGCYSVSPPPLGFCTVFLQHLFTLVGGCYLLQVFFRCVESLTDLVRALRSRCCVTRECVAFRDSSGGPTVTVRPYFCFLHCPRSWIALNFVVTVRVKVSYTYAYSVGFHWERRV